MSSIPLHLQRRFEQRWAARFRPVDPAAPEKHQPEKQMQQSVAPAEAKRKTRPLGPVGLRATRAK
jgi:hypothetical protein